LVSEANEFLILRSLFEDLPAFSPKSFDFLPQFVNFGSGFEDIPDSFGPAVVLPVFRFVVQFRNQSFRESDRNLIHVNRDAPPSLSNSVRPASYNRKQFL
jgi:hypothetical protein